MIPFDFILKIKFDRDFILKMMPKNMGTFKGNVCTCAYVCVSVSTCVRCVHVLCLVHACFFFVTSLIFSLSLTHSFTRSFSYTLFHTLFLCFRYLFDLTPFLCVCLSVSLSICLSVSFRQLLAFCMSI